MAKLAHLRDGEWTDHSHPPVFEISAFEDGTPRLVAGVPGGDPLVLTRLAAMLTPPFLLLYVLHTPRGEGEPGRYQSPKLDAAGLRSFLEEFGPLLGGDARHDFWIHSPADQATLVWDRHNLLHAYGPLDRFESTLRSRGFTPGRAAVPDPHAHHYHSEHDALAAHLLDSFQWYRADLQPEDVQT